MSDATATDPTTPTPPANPNSPELKEILAKLAEFTQLSPGASASGTTLEYLRDVPITVTAKLGHTIMPIGDLLKLGQGAVVELEQLVTQPIELTVRGVPFATGEIVVVDEHFAVRIKALLPPRTVKGEG